MKRKLLTALSATTLLLVSCGGSSDPVDAYVEIAVRTNCALADLAKFYESDEVSSVESDEDFEQIASEFQSLHAEAADSIQAAMRDMAAVDWPEYVVDDVDVFLTELAKSVTFFEQLSAADTLTDVMAANANASADVTTGEVIKAKLGITDEQVPDTNDIDELIAFCS